MAESDLKALQYPKVWPPTDLPPYPPHRWSRVPILGLAFRYFTWLRRVHQLQRDVLDPIAGEIVSQLKSRPTRGPWPLREEERQVAQIVSDIVGLEKGLPRSPALHPDDPFPLLFWGPYDDLTPMIFRIECQEKLQRSLPESIFMDAWHQRWTISRFIEQCIESTSASRSTGG